MHFGNDPNVSAEEYLLKRPKTHWQKFQARFLKKPVCLGKFQPIGASGPMDLYFFWCPVHQKYQVSYLCGYGNEVDGCKGDFICRDCIKERAILRTQISEEGYREL